MTLDTRERFGTTDLTDEYTDRTGKDGGVGTFIRGTLTKLVDAYHVEGASKRGCQFRTFVERVYINYQNELDLSVGETYDVADLDFRLGENELHLRMGTE